MLAVILHAFDAAECVDDRLEIAPQFVPTESDADDVNGALLTEEFPDMTHRHSIVHFGGQLTLMTSNKQINRHSFPNV